MLNEHNLKYNFPRNYSIEKEYKDKYNNLINNNEFFHNRLKKDIFLISLIFGYKCKIRKKLKKPSPLINTSSFTDENIWQITSVAINEKG